MAAERRDRRDRPPAGVARVAGRPPEPLRLVHDQEIDPALDRLVGQLRPLDQHLQRDDGAAMHVERVEVGAEVARHVGEALRVEQREDLVVLPPELAQPLDGQRLRRDDEAALDSSGVHEAIQDQAGLDGLAEADLVGEQPAHGIAGASRARRHGAGAGRAGRVRRGTSPGRRLRESPEGAGCRAGLGVDGSNHSLGTIEPRIPNPESRSRIPVPAHRRASAHRCWPRYAASCRYAGSGRRARALRRP